MVWTQIITHVYKGSPTLTYPPNINIWPMLQSDTPDRLFDTIIDVTYQYHASTYNNLPLRYALWTGAIDAHLVGRCVLYSYCFLNHFDSINRNGKQMKPSPTRLTKAQWCGITYRWQNPTSWDLKVLPIWKASKLYTTLSSTSTTTCFAPMYKQKAAHVYDELRRSFETFQYNVNKLTSNVHR